jgi:hypothetical protein
MNFSSVLEDSDDLHLGAKRDGANGDRRAEKTLAQWRGSPGKGRHDNNPIAFPVSIACAGRFFPWKGVVVELVRNTNMVRLAGIEPTTLGFGGQYSIH